MDYRKWGRQPEQVTNIFLDPKNIRQEIDKDTQDALIADLFSNEDAMQVVESIVENGFFPDELPIVVNEGGKLVVIEGNRRVAALKVLINPALVPAYHYKIKELAEGHSPIREVEVVIAPHRDQVNKLLAIKHTKNTRRNWKPLRQAYFYHAQIDQGKKIEDLRKEYLNVDIPKFIRMWEIHTIARSLKYDDEDVARRVHDQRNFPVSTIERLYDDAQFRKLLNFNFTNDGEVNVHSQKSEFDKSLKKVVTDAVNKVIDTRKLNNDEGKKDYYSHFEPLKKVLRQ